MHITSTAFQNGEFVPPQYSRYHDDKTPPLHFEDVPANARSLVLLMDDPDAPRGLFTHWVVFDIDPKTSDIGQDRAPETPARQGRNSWGETQYGGPRPPSGEHHYFFRLYALDKILELPRGVSRERVEQAMEGHVIATAELMGRYAAEHPAGAAY